MKFKTYETDEKKILGLSGLNHDACATLLHGREIKFAGHSERYSEIKNDEYINHALLADVKRYGDWDTVVWFEQPLIKKQRQLVAGQYSEVFTKKNLPSNYLKQYGIKPDYYVPHHLSHASAAYFTSPYRNTIGIVIDAIGEFDTTTIWHIQTLGRETTFKKIWSKTYPNSLGLWYSAMTQRLGLNHKKMSTYLWVWQDGVRYIQRLNKSCGYSYHRTYTEVVWIGIVSIIQMMVQMNGNLQ